MTSQSRYAALLPSVIAESAVSGGTPLAPRLLALVEPLFAGVHARLDAISDCSDPLKADPEFLPWLASWVSLVLRADWTVDQQRRVLAQIIPLYRKRGTKDGLEQYLKIYAGPGVTIRDELATFQIGQNSTVGVDAVVGGLPPYFFIVNIAFDTPDPAMLKKKSEAVKAVLEIEKPAHTHYKLEAKGPTFQIGHQSTIGINTLI